MADTFKDLYSEIVAWAPFLPVVLAQRWVKRRFREIQGRSLWSCQLAESAFYVPAVVSTSTVTVTSGSTTVLAVAAFWDASVVGKQFYTGGHGPFYTITAFLSSNSVTLDRAWAGATAAGVSYEISQVYQVCPSDLLSLEAVIDNTNQWRLHLQIPRARVDRWDPTRIGAGVARALIAAPFDSSGNPRFEMWQRVSAASTFPLVYRKEVPFSSDSDTVPKPFNSEAIVEGALANLARWPGIENRKNPVYGLEASDRHERRFNELILSAEREDQEIYQTNVTYWWDSIRFAPLDATWLQSHDFPSEE